MGVLKALSHNNIPPLHSSLQLVFNRHTVNMSNSTYTVNMTENFIEAENTTDKQSFTFVPAIFFILLSLSWLLDERPRKSQMNSNCCLSRFRTYLPLLGVYMVTVSSISIILTMMSISDMLSSYTMITIYATFSVGGLLNIILFYVKTFASVLPKNTVSLATALCFLVELILLQNSDRCLLVTILSCLTLAVLRLLNNSTILNLGLMVMTMTQGSWIIHIMLMDIHKDDKMVYLYYSWHILALFVFNLALNVILNYCYKSQAQAAPQDQENSNKNLTNTVKKTINTFGELNMDIIANEKTLVEQSKSREDLEIINVLNSIDKMVNEPQTSSSSVSTEELTDSEKSSFKERISPLEEFNTLFRNADCVRKSIKLKESDIV